MSGKVEVRAGVWMAYEEHCFGEPWTTLETVVMIHGNSESSRAWTCWVPHLARHYRVIRRICPASAVRPGPDYGWIAAELAAGLTGHPSLISQRERVDARHKAAHDVDRYCWPKCETL